MLRNRYAIMCMAAAIFLTVSVSGCGSKNSQDTTKVAEPQQIGIVDMTKAAKAHPKYTEFTRLQQEYNTLVQQLEAETQEIGRSTELDLSTPTAALTGLNEALSQEFDAKIKAKQDELQVHLNEILAQAKADVSAEMDAYTKEIDQVYQPQIFSLQLKIKTVQASKEEMANMQKQLEQLQNERADKLSVKENEMVAHIDATMSPAKAAVEVELDAYGKQLQAELDQRGAGKTAEIATRVQPSTSTKVSTAGLDEKQKQLGMRQKEIEVLHDFIEKDIKDKAAKIAAERNLEAVLVEVTVNVSGIDITNDIIAAFNK